MFRANAPESLLATVHDPSDGMCVSRDLQAIAVSIAWFFSERTGIVDVTAS